MTKRPLAAIVTEESAKHMAQRFLDDDYCIGQVSDDEQPVW